MPSANDSVAGKVGVFLCDCGDDIGGVIDLPALARRIEALDQRPVVRRTRYWCSRAGRALLREVVAEHDLDAVVIAGCSPRTHGGLMREAAEAAGLNRNRAVLVNLKEHCASVHPGHRASATSKALRLVRIGIERARLAIPLEPISAAVEHSAAVIGGGVSGMTAAGALAARGIPVVLVERARELGGLLRSVNLLYPTYCDASEYAREMSDALHADPNVEVLTGCRVVGVSGHVGSYRLAVETATGAREVAAGAVILATGADVLRPLGLFGYGSNPKVVTQLELEAMLREGLPDQKRIVMIQCAGSRNADRPYCSRVCCTATVKNTITVIESVPGATITVLSRGFAQYVGDLDRAKDAGVTFIRYDPERPPEVSPDAVDVFDAISSRAVSVPYDLVVLATPLIAREDAAELAGLLNLPADDYCFIAEPHTKLRPGTFAPCGVFVAGSVHWPATVTECLNQAHAAATRAAALIDAGSVEREPLVARVDELACRGCERCVEACAHGAPAIREGDDGFRVSGIDEVRCVGCGVCVRVCPSSAITLSHLTQDQLLSMVGAAVD